MDFKHEIIALKDRGGKNHVDENVSDHGKVVHEFYGKNRGRKNFL